MNRSYNMNIDTGEKTWLTPRYIIDALGPFDLDPCCPPKMPWRTAAEMVCRPADGLAVDWRGTLARLRESGLVGALVRLRSGTDTDNNSETEDNQ